MANFFDDFERANGALGGDWHDLNAATAIAGGSVTSTGHYITYNLSLSNSDRVQATCHVYYTAQTANASGPAVKMAAGGIYCYFARVVLVSTVPTLQICIHGNTVVTVLASLALSGTVLPYIKLDLVWDLGVLTATLNDNQTLTVNDSTYATQNCAGISGVSSAQPIADCLIVAGSALQFSVTPSLIPNFGSTTELTFSGVGTAWTPGTPGAPVFTCNHGTLSDQMVGSTTSATATYAPGTYLGTVTFTDPSTGLTATAVVSSNPLNFPEAYGFFSTTAIEYIERSAIADTANTIANRGMNVAQSGDPISMIVALGTLLSAVSEVNEPTGGIGNLISLVNEAYYLLNGGSNWGDTGSVLGNTSLLKLDTASILALLDIAEDGGSFGTGTLARALAGYPGGNIQDVLTALSGMSAPDLSTITSALTAIRGDTSTSLATLLSGLTAIRTTHHYSLGDVMGAIADIPGAPAPATALGVMALVAALLLAAPTGGASVAAAAVAVGAGPILDIAQIVETMGMVEELADIATKIVALLAKPSGTYDGPPAWPGEDGVTLFSPVALSDGLVISGPLDGLLVTITTHPAKAGQYTFGSHVSYTHVGAVVFVSDHGECEHPESIGLDAQVITPRTMRHADSAIVRLNGGFGGTARRWTINA
jgi:hypothetical protein